MNKFFKVFTILSVLVFAAAYFCFGEAVKEPNVAGQFYPDNPQALSNMIDNFLNAAPEQNTPDILALISPHAGYIYSGPVAAYGYKAIQGRNYKTVVVLAPSHHVGFSGVSIWPRGAFNTSLGALPVDSQFAEQLIKESSLAGFRPDAFKDEHSLEVQLPFLQKVLGDFKIVPVVMGQPSFQDCKNFALSLAKVIGERDDVLVVASTDLSHFHTLKDARVIDGQTLKLLAEFNAEGLWNSSTKYDPCMCGLVPVVTTLLYAEARGQKNIKILKYATSADATGDAERVVGYASAIIYKISNPKGASQMLSIEQRKKLLEIARQSLEGYIKTGKRTDFSVSDPELNKERGAFVTLTENGDLRGCIGRIVGDQPICKVIAGMAIEAGTGDPRFHPVQEKDLKNLKFEISILSPLEKIDDVNKIQVGTHGIIIRKGFNSGLLLPQVATEYGWDRNTFLEQTCHKAGLPGGCWKQGADIYIFSAEVFSEDTR